MIFTMKNSSFTIKKNDFWLDTGISSETTIPEISSETTIPEISSETTIPEIRVWRALGRRHHAAHPTTCLLYTSPSPRD